MLVFEEARRFHAIAVKTPNSGHLVKLPVTLLLYIMK